MNHHSFQSVINTAVDPVLLEQDWKNARQIDTVRLGRTYLFYPAMWKVRYLPCERIQWAYLRAEENRVSVGCRRTMMDIWYMLLYVDGKQVAKIEFQNKEIAKEALTTLSEINEKIVIGYSEDTKKQVLG